MTFAPRSPEENVRRGLAATDMALTDAQDGGIGKNAMHRKDLGSITFVWGKHGNPKKRYRPGIRISHFVAKHGVEAMSDMMDAVAMGRIQGRRRAGTSSERTSIEHKGTLVAFTLFRGGDKETWLLTGFKVDGNTDRPFNLDVIDRSPFVRADIKGSI